MTTKTTPEPKEFGLSDEVPVAVLECDLKRAQDAWQVRSDAAAEAVTLPRAPYRIKGVSEEGAWFVEACTIKCSTRPSSNEDYYSYSMLLLSMRLTRSSVPAEYYTRQIKTLDADVPTAKKEWGRVGRTRKGWMTYAKAAAWLRDWLEPVRDESTYFTEDGHAV